MNQFCLDCEINKQTKRTTNSTVQIYHGSCSNFSQAFPLPSLLSPNLPSFSTSSFNLTIASNSLQSEKFTKNFSSASTLPGFWRTVFLSFISDPENSLSLPLVGRSKRGRHRGRDRMEWDTEGENERKKERKEGERIKKGKDDEAALSFRRKKGPDGVIL